LLLVVLGGESAWASVPTGLSGTPTLGTSAFSTAGGAAVTTADVTVSGIKYWAVTGLNNVDFHSPTIIFPPEVNALKADGPGIYFNVGSFVAVTPNRVLTVARTSSLGTFTLSTVVIGGYQAGDSFLNIRVTGVDLSDQDVAFTIGGSASTTHSGAGQKTLTLGGGTATPLKAFKLSFDLPGGTAASDFTLISFTIANATNPSVAPVFVGATTTLAVTQGSSNNAATALLHINDPDVGETITWSQKPEPRPAARSRSSSIRTATPCTMPAPTR
ncbi:MAG: hypothetical protein NTV51_01675, partial [Verrucomicrobia bacterium]|nr:hypothetical protein [Verrucomicrobiota bacterium]